MQNPYENLEKVVCEKSKSGTWSRLFCLLGFENSIGNRRNQTGVSVRKVAAILLVFSSLPKLDSRPLFNWFYDVADTRIQTEVEDWVRLNWMPTQYGSKFSRERVRLRSGGVFDFDAVSDDFSIVATISTSGAKTAGNKYAVGKMLKLRSDMLFLTMVEANRRIIVLTEHDMWEQCKKEFAAGRVPREIEFACAEIPQDLRKRLVESREKASRESLGKAATAP